MSELSLSVIDVVIRSAIRSLSELATQLPTRDDATRKHSLIKFIEKTHGDCVRLHVLLGWLNTQEQVCFHC
jgi:hypothetical protein